MNSLLRVLNAAFTSGVQVKGRLGGESSEGFCHPTVILDESTIEIGKSEETLQNFS